MKYLYCKGRIVTITWKHGGDIVKVLARPGQYVYDTTTRDMRFLNEDEYIVEEDIRIKERWIEYLVPQQNIKPKAGRLVNAIHLAQATVYEKKLRHKGILTSPIVNSEEPLGEVGEILAFKYLGKLRLVQILKVVNSLPPCFELSNGDCIERGSLKIFYRRTNEYEKAIFQKKEAYQNRQIVLAIS
jgi:hypothetical protein